MRFMLTGFLRIIKVLGESREALFQRLFFEELLFWIVVPKNLLTIAQKPAGRHGILRSLPTSLAKIVKIKHGKAYGAVLRHNSMY